MSFQTRKFGVTINKDQLLNLFLGQGDLSIRLYGQKPITLREFSEQHIVCVEGETAIYEAKIRGVSEDRTYHTSMEGLKSFQFEAAKCLCVLSNYTFKTTSNNFTTVLG
jgi:hypothetical protein